MKLPISIFCILHFAFCITAHAQGFGQSLAFQGAAAIRPAAGGGGGGPPSSGLVQELDASTISGANNDPIGTWTAAVGLNATSSSTLRPLLITAAKNGLNILRFDGTDDTMATASFSSAITQTCVIFIVFKLNSVANNQRFLSSIADESGDRNIVYFDNAPAYKLYGGAAFANAFGASDPNTSWHIMSIEFAGDASKCRVDGATEETTSTGSGTTGKLTGLRISGDYDGTIGPTSVDVAEILIYQGAIADKSAHFSYLNTKWAIY